MKSLLTLTMSVLISAILLPISANAADEYNVTNGVTMAGTPLGVHGIDTYTLKETGTAAEGSSEFTAEHDGVSYYFASENSKRLFQRKPEAYLPEFGGFCALAIGLGKKFDGDPTYADIYKGKLYVFVDRAVYKMYVKDKAGTIAKSEKRWPSLKHTAVSDL